MMREREYALLAEALNFAYIRQTGSPGIIAAIAAVSIALCKDNPQFNAKQFVDTATEMA